MISHEQPEIELKKQAETVFLRHQISSTIKYIRPAVLLLGILFFLFIIPDSFINQDPLVVRIIFAIRFIFLVLVIILYLLLKYRPIQQHLAHLITIYSFAVSVCFLLIYYFYEAPNFYLQSFSAIFIIIIVFNLNYYWLHAVYISFLLGTGFVAVTYLRPEPVETSSLAAVTVYIFLITIMSGITSYRLNKYKQVQYLNTKELKRISELDALTGIYNRGKFDQELSKWIELAKRYNHALTIILFDLDDLKHINDLYGHIVGDKILVRISEIVHNIIRNSDIFVRWGGDEFAILLPHTEKKQAVELAERIRNTIASHHFEQAGYLSCSFGVASLSEDDNSNTLLNKADKMLYKAKQIGKNQVVS